MLQHFQQWVQSEMCLEGWRAAGEVSSFPPRQQVLNELAVQRPFRAQRLGGSAEFCADGPHLRPRALGSGKWKGARREPTRDSPHLTAGYRPGPTRYWRDGIGKKLEIPGDVDRRGPVKGASNPPTRTVRHIPLPPRARKRRAPPGALPHAAGPRPPACRGRNVPFLRLR